MELVFREGDDHILEASLMELHKRSRHWVSELEFWQNEVSFLKKLVRRFVQDLVVEEGTLAHADMLLGSLKKVKEETMPELLKEVRHHEQHLGVILENPFYSTETAYREEHSRLEKEISDFAREFKMLKQEIFAIAEHFQEEGHQKPPQLGE